MLTSIAFKFGSAPNQPKLSFELRPSVTIFVGPNNSGKSQALRDIYNHFWGGRNPATPIIEDLVIASLSEAEGLREIERMKSPPQAGDVQNPDQIYVLGQSGRSSVPRHLLLQALQIPMDLFSHQRSTFSAYVAFRSILLMEGPSRIQLISPSSRGDLKAPSTPFARLLVDNAKREMLREKIHDATGLYLALDATSGDQISLKLGSSPPPNERSMEDETLNYMRAAKDIGLFSDGIKAFTGVMLQLHASDPKIIVIDEPEAFLHPSLAHKLGKELATGAAAEGKQVFASTHSAQFLMGAIASGAEVNIVRLTYQDGVATARLLANSDLKVLMQDPLLRSVGMLESLFFDYVVVGEGNSDRAFYQEINERLLATNDHRGLPRTLFLNAGSKQTIPRILAPLRKLGIPAAGIVDVDIVKGGGSEWTQVLAAIGIPDLERNAYAARRTAVETSLRAANPDFPRCGGLKLLASAQLETAENLFRDLAGYGFFVVPSGELEQWLPNLDVQRTKNAWLPSVFEQMGSNPNANSYVKPITGDVWDFIGLIAEWAKNTNRRGIPT